MPYIFRILVEVAEARFLKRASRIFGIAATLFAIAVTVSMSMPMSVSDAHAEDAKPRAMDGRQIYDAHCARCHGTTGLGDGDASTMQRPLPRNFITGDYKFRSTPIGTLPTVVDIEKVVTHGIWRTSMPGFEPFLNKEEIRSVSEYVRELSASISSVRRGAEPAIPARTELDSVVPDSMWLAEGRELFATNCAMCHGNDGRGLGPLAGTTRDENKFWMRPADLTEPLEYGGGANPSDVWMRLKAGMAEGRMPSYDGILSDDQMESIALYVKTLQISPKERTLPSPTVWREALPANVRGEYMVRAMSCALCHNSYEASGRYYADKYMAGGVAITLPGLGVFPTKNITSHAEFGLGTWTEEEIAKTITTGYAPDRRLEAFSMPWVFFSHLKEEDALDIAAYVKTLPAIRNDVPKRKYYPVWQRLWSRLRQLLGFEYGRLEYPPFNQGKYEAEVNLDHLENDSQ